MITGKGGLDAPNVVVIDFGLASGFHAEQMAGGTPGYMPPEVWQMGLWTPKGDTFSMGVTFYSMITFKKGGPFVQGATTMDMVKFMTLRGQLPPPTGILQRSPALNQMITKMLSNNFLQRPIIAKVLQDPWMQQQSDE